MHTKPPRPGGKDKPEGFRCRFCHSRISTVSKTETFTITYYGQQKTLIKRRRVCFHCGIPFTTIETVEDEENPGNPELVTPPPLPPATPYKPPTTPTEKTGVYSPPVNPIAALSPPKKPPAPQRESKAAQQRNKIRKRRKGG
jgi:hypothetical protein